MITAPALISHTWTQWQFLAGLSLFVNSSTLLSHQRQIRLRIYFETGVTVLTGTHSFRESLYSVTLPSLAYNPKHKNLVLGGAVFKERLLITSALGWKKLCLIKQTLVRHNEARVTRQNITYQAIYLVELRSGLDTASTCQKARAQPLYRKIIVIRVIKCKKNIYRRVLF